MTSEAVTAVMAPRAIVVSMFVIEHRLYSSIRDSFYNFRLFFLSTGTQSEEGLWELSALLTSLTMADPTV